MIARCCFVEWEKERALLWYLAYLQDIYRPTLPINKLLRGIVSVQVIDGPSIVPAWPLLWAWVNECGLGACCIGWYGMLGALGALGVGGLGAPQACFQPMKQGTPMAVHCYDLGCTTEHLIADVGAQETPIAAGFWACFHFNQEQLDTNMN